MNKAFKLLLALLLSLPALAQNADSTKWARFINLYDNPYKKFDSTRIVGFQSSSLISGKRIPNNFIYPFVFGNKLEKETINQTLDNTKNKQFLIETNHDVYFINLDKHLFKKKNINWYIKAGNHHRTYVNATDGAMRLIFKGNTDTTVYDFSNSNYYNIRLNKVGGGAYYHQDKTKRPYNASFGVFIIQALNYGNFRTYINNSLHGNEDSFDLAVNYDAAFASNGIGMGSEFIFNQNINDKRSWGFRLENFGFAYFNEKATTYNAKGNYKFDGFYIEDIGRLGEDNYLQNQLDSFTNPLTNLKENQSKTIFIAPTSFFYYNLRLKGGYYQVGIRHNGTYALPAAEFRYFNFLKPSLLLGVSAGTIGQIYLNTDINWCIKRKLFVQAAIYHLEALAFPKTFGGLGGGFGMQYAF